MDLDFGLDIRRNLFNPDIVIKDVIKNNAREQLRKYFSNLLVSNIDVITQSEDKNLPQNSVRIVLEVSPMMDQNIKIKLDQVVKG